MSNCCVISNLLYGSYFLNFLTHVEETSRKIGDSNDEYKHGENVSKVGILRKGETKRK